MPFHSQTPFRSQDARGSRSRETLERLQFRERYEIEDLISNLERAKASGSCSQEEEELCSLLSINGHFENSTNSNKQIPKFGASREYVVPWNQRRRMSSPGGYRIGNNRKPKTFWNNGKLFKRCEERFVFKEMCLQQRSSEYDVRLLNSRPRGTVVQTLQCPDQSEFPIIIAQNENTHEVRVSHGGVPLVSRCRVESFHVAKEFVVLVNHPFYLVIGFKNLHYQFHFSERLSFESCDRVRERLIGSVKEHLPDVLCQIVEGYVGPSQGAVYSRNYLLDLQRGVSQSKTTSHTTPLCSTPEATRGRERPNVKKQTKLHKLEKALARNIPEHKHKHEPVYVEQEIVQNSPPLRYELMTC